jgi:hypothetical protein
MMDNPKQPKKAANSLWCFERSAKTYEPIGDVDPANGLRKYRRNMATNQPLRCLQLNNATAKNF